MSSPRTDNRWKSRWLLAAMLTTAIAIVPVASSFGAAYEIARYVRQPGTIEGFALWWLVLLGVCSGTYVLATWVARRGLPLALLLKLNMAFPGRAPKRLAAARRAASVRDLGRRVQEARERGVASEPILAAEQVVSLAASLNAHDRTTRGHAERVRALTDMIADELRLPPVDRDRLRWSSLLHDIGKLTVHPEVLNKSAALSDTEWAVIRRHPLEGAKITAPLAGWLGPWARTIAEHHERFDGAGYPFGRSGREISLGARIVAVADSYDVMTAARSYKRAVTPEQARQELARCAGTQFDPDIVKAFLAVSIWRLRLAAPLSWLAAVPIGRALNAIGRAVGSVGHVVVAGLAVSAGVVGLGVAAPGASPALSSPPVGTHSASGSSRVGPSTSIPARSGLADGHSTTVPTSQRASGPDGSSPGKGNASSPGATTTAASSKTSVSKTAGSPTTTTTTTAAAQVPGTTTTTSPSVPASLVIANGPGGNAGRPEQGDQIIVTYAVAPSPSAFCSSWSASSAPDLVDPSVVINANQPSSGDDVIGSVTDSADCPGGFHFGSIDLGQRGYFNSAQTIGGPGSQCSATSTSGCTRIHWDGKNTLTITLGQPQNGEPTQKTPVVAVYTPDPALGVAGTISSAKSVLF
jgi:putative nucleotidyltransferase with HDIG domain